MDIYDYLSNYIITDIAPSPIHGIGTFALRDLNVGETLFTTWKGDSRIYTMERWEFAKLPHYVKRIIFKSYENKPEYDVIWFRLFTDCYFDLANPIVYTNTAGNHGNIDSVTKMVIKPIKAGEEILGTYNLKNTLL
jgi:hypothetical protein